MFLNWQHASSSKQGRQILALALTAAIAGCGAGSPTVPTVSVVSLQIKGIGALTRRGESRQLQAEAKMSDGSTRDVTALAAWTSSPDSVAALSPQGVLTALSEGRATVAARIENVAAEGQVDVDYTSSLAIEVPGGVSVFVFSAIGQEVQFRATGTLYDGTVRDATALVSWSSQFPELVGVSQSGVVRALSASGGETAIRVVSRNGKSASTRVTVRLPSQ